MNVLITGITGYIGSRLAPRLQRDGHVVRRLSRHIGQHLATAAERQPDGAGADVPDTEDEGGGIAHSYRRSADRCLKSDRTGVGTERRLAATDNGGCS